MRRYSTFALCLISIIAITVACISSQAQTTSKSAGSPMFTVSIAVKQPEMSVGQATWVTIYVKLLADNASYNDDFLPHVEGANGEPSKTIYHRQRRHEPGLPELSHDRMATFPHEVKAGDTDIRKLDLTKYYDLGTPGKYSVYVEYLDESGKWQRTNIISFTLQAAAQ
jgi:hypothetical protein